MFKYKSNVVFDIYWTSLIIAKSAFKPWSFGTSNHKRNKFGLSSKIRRAYFVTHWHSCCINLWFADMFPCFFDIFFWFLTPSHVKASYMCMGVYVCLGYITGTCVHHWANSNLWFQQTAKVRQWPHHGKPHRLIDLTGKGLYTQAIFVFDNCSIRLAILTYAHAYK